MSNCYDIEIKMNYFLSGTIYKESLEDFKKFKKWYADHEDYWETITESKEAFYEAKEEIYGRKNERFVL